MNSADSQQPPISGANRRALESIFHHPTAHNLEWTHTKSLKL